MIKIKIKIMIKIKKEWIRLLGATFIIIEDYSEYSVVYFDITELKRSRYD